MRYFIALTILLFVSPAYAVVCPWIPEDGSFGTNGTGTYQVVSSGNGPSGCNAGYCGSTSGFSCPGGSSIVVTGCTNPGNESCASQTGYQSVIECRDYLATEAECPQEVPPPDPDHCNDGIAGDGEAGADCGGPCSSPCEPKCPSGYTAATVSGVVQGCDRFVPPDSLGNCPGGFEKAEGGDCYHGTDPILSKSELPLDTTSLNLPTGWKGTPDTKLITVQVTDDVTNEDGTRSVTRTTSTQDLDLNGNPLPSQPGVVGHSSTTTTYSPTGEILSEVTTEGWNYDPQSDTANYDLEAPGLEDEDWGIPDGTGINTADGKYDSVVEAPEKKDISAFGSSVINSLPIMALANDFQINTSGQTCSIDIPDGIYGVPCAISFCRWQELLAMVGSILLVITQAFAILIVLKGWK